MNIEICKEWISIKYGHIKPTRLILLTIISLLLLAGCGGEPSAPVSATPTPDWEPTTPPEPPAPPPPRLETVTLVAAGDILMHNTQIWSGQQPDGTYHFDFFGPVKELLQEGDYTSTNLEAAMAGPATGYTGYPSFNSPDAIADTLKDAGFDLVVTANNHILDRGYKGALRTLDVLNQAGLDTVGAYKSQLDADQFLIKSINGINIGYLAYTYGTNGIPIPEKHPYLVNLMNTEKILSDIKALRAQVDVLILVAHWGVEYRHEPTSEQKELARQFLNAGVDIILGSHPHVIEPMEIVNIDGKDKLVIYSMGNFVGHQRGPERNSGVILKFKVVKNLDSKESYLDEVTYTPTYSHSYQENGKLMFRVVPVEDTIALIKEGKDPYLKASDLPTLEEVLKQTRGLLGEEFRSEKTSSNE